MPKARETEVVEPPSRVALPPLHPKCPRQKGAPANRMVPGATTVGASKVATTHEESEFRKRHYPGVSHAQWSEWRWQMAHRVTTSQELFRHVSLTAQESLASRDVVLPLAITPYYLSLMDGNDPSCPIRRAMVPTFQESVLGPGEADDPLGEEGHSPVHGLVHRYPDRVLFLATPQCAAYCRYCTRSRLVGQHQVSSLRVQWDACIAYIAATPCIRDVIISGGDPLTLPDDAIAYLLGQLRTIPHVEIIRLGTKTPAVMPQRITPALVRVLRKHHPLFMSCHMMHPKELTPASTRAFARLADAGIPLGSQTVLLAGINDDSAVLKRLLHGLLMARVRPYYLYQCDPIRGSAHFRTTVAKGLELMGELRGHTSGYAVPTYVIDAPGGGGKVPISAQTMLGQDAAGLTLRNYEGNLYQYPDTAPAFSSLAMPFAAQDLPMETLQ